MGEHDHMVAINQYNEGKGSQPWYVELLLGFGGWIAGLVLALAIAAFIFLNMPNASDRAYAIAALVIGLLITGLGVSIGISSRGDFLRQLAVSLIAGGLTGATFGAWQLGVEILGGPESAGTRSDLVTGQAGLATAASYAILVVFILRVFRERTLAFLSAAALFTILFVSLNLVSRIADFGIWQPQPLLFALAGSAGALGLVLTGGRSRLRPLGSFATGLVFSAWILAIPSTLDGPGLFGFFGPVESFAGRILFGLTVLALVIGLSRRLDRPFVLALGIVLVLCAGLFPPIVLLAVIILLSGFVADHRGLVISGLGALIIAGAYFYYDLSLTLLTKSMILTGVGLALTLGAVITQISRRAGGPADLDKDDVDPALPAFDRALDGLPDRARRDRPAILAVLAMVLILGAAAGRTLIGAYQLEASFTNAETIYLPLGPRDPRSLIQGDYMRLRFDPEIYPPRLEWQDLPTNGTVYLQLDENRVARFSRLPSPATERRPDEIRVQYYRTRRSGIVYTPTSFFFQEGEAEQFSAARFAIVKVTAAGRTLLTGLADSDREPIEP